MSIKISNANDFAAWIKDMQAIAPIVCLHNRRLKIYSKRMLLSEVPCFKLYCSETYVDKNADIENWLRDKADDPEDSATYMTDVVGMILTDSNGNGKILTNYMFDHYLIDEVLPQHSDVFWCFQNRTGKLVYGSDSDLRSILCELFQEEMKREVKQRISVLMADPNKIEPDPSTTPYEKQNFNIGLFQLCIGIDAYEGILENTFDNSRSEYAQFFRKISYLRRILLDPSNELLERKHIAHELLLQERQQKFMDYVAQQQARINLAWAEMPQNDPDRYEKICRKGKVYNAVQLMGESCRNIMVTANIQAYMTEQDFDEQNPTMLSVAGIKLDSDLLRDFKAYENGIYVKLPSSVYDQCYRCDTTLDVENITEIRYRKNIVEI